MNLGRWPWLLHRASRPRTRWRMLMVLAVMTALSLVLLFLLAQATNQQELYERHYTSLLILNGIVAALLLSVIAWVVGRLLRSLRRGRFGSRLLLKLALIFALVGVLPGLLIYAVSYQFVSRSIESWFNYKVEAALDAGLNLGRASLDALAADCAEKAQLSAAQLSGVPDATSVLTLERIRQSTDAKEISLWNTKGQLLASVGGERFSIHVEKPPAQWIKQLRNKRVLTQMEGLDDVGSSTVPNVQARIRAWAVVPPMGYGLVEDVRYLQLIVPIPPNLVRNAVVVQEANREYQERAFAREGLKRMYFGSLTLTLFLGVFGALLLMGLLGNQLARPLVLLAEGVQQVANGDLSPKLTLSAQDELAGLTRSFAQMTQQLADARGHIETSMGQLDAARTRLQTILDNLSSGVLVLDEQGRIVSGNPGATRVLRLPMATHVGQRLSEIAELVAFAEVVDRQFELFQQESRLNAVRGLEHWQSSYDLPSHPNNTITLLIRGAELPGPQRLLVLDDISELVSAQRAQAWAEVARRLAHEIKNPLTPIQLSAERLEMKLSPALPEAQRQLLTKGVKTIVDQVDAMKRLVNEFRDFGRLPKADLQAIDLNLLIKDVITLYSHSPDTVKPQCELQEPCPQVWADAQQLRQVIHNLVQNAQDACLGRVDPQVWVRTALVNDAKGEIQAVRLTVSDNGPGFTDSIIHRAFEPYVSTKDKGTGLGLAVVKKIADEHGARIDMLNRMQDGEVQGAQVSLSLRVAH